MSTAAEKPKQTERLARSLIFFDRQRQLDLPPPHRRRRGSSRAIISNYGSRPFCLFSMILLLFPLVCPNDLLEEVKTILDEWFKQRNFGQTQGENQRITKFSTKNKKLNKTKPEVPLPCGFVFMNPLIVLHRELLNASSNTLLVRSSS